MSPVWGKNRECLRAPHLLHPIYSMPSSLILVVVDFSPSSMFPTTPPVLMGIPISSKRIEKKIQKNYKIKNNNKSTSNKNNNNQSRDFCLNIEQQEAIFT